MNKRLKWLLIAFAMALVLTSCCYLDSALGIGLLEEVNMQLEDGVYQNEESLSERRIVIFGIDERALEELGPLPWDRSIYADIIYMLNEDPENCPVAIGFDVLFAGYKEEESDMYLVDAASMVDNVIFGSMATIGEEIEVDSDGNFSVNDYAISLYERPFDELLEVSDAGFINNMPNTDGVVRNSTLRLELPDGTIEDSFAYKLYKRYAERFNLDMEPDEEIPMNARYQWYLPYKCLPGGYEEISIAALLNGETMPGEFKDCIALIGPYAEGLQDSFFTPIDKGRKMNGVEIHANIIQAMMDKRFVRRGSETWQLIALFIIIFLCTIVFYKLRLAFTISFWIGIIAGYVGVAYIFYKNDILIKVFYIPLMVTLVFFFIIGAKYLHEAKEKRKTVGIFKRYVAPQVVDELFKAGTDALELGGKMTDIACLFVDIRGFTPMSEVLTPPQIVDVLNTYLNLTNECIMKNEGTLDKFIGDATMALYNAPMPLDDYIFKAVRTAWDMKQGAVKLGQELRERYGRDVNFGIGVHCGKAVVGNIGTKMRMDYTAIGDTVNTAARLESNAKAGEILISEDVYHAIEGRVEVKSYGTTIKLKGKSDSFEIFSVERILE